MIDRSISPRTDIPLLPRRCPVDRLLVAQARERNVEVEELVRAEGMRATQFNGQCTAEDVARMATWHEVAQRKFFTPGVPPLAAAAPRILLGPNSKVVDHLISGPGVQRLVAAICSQGQEEALIAAIRQGPASGQSAWPIASTPVELVAGVIRWGTMHGKEKCRVRATDEVRSWAVTALHSVGFDTSPRLGGVAAIGTQLCEALGAIPCMMALGTLSPDILAYMSPETPVVGSDAQHTRLDQLPRAAQSAPNLSFQHKGDAIPLPLAHCTIGESTCCLESIGELDILVTGAGEIPFAGFSNARARELGERHDAMVLTGAHRLRTAEETAEFFSHVQAIGAGGCAIALIQSDARAPESESALLQSLRATGAIDYWGMNGSEAFKILETVRAGERFMRELSPAQRERLEDALSCAREATELWPSGREHPRWIAESALLIQEIFQVPMVRVRGRAVDVLVTGRDVADQDPLRVRNHLIVSRNLATLKVAEFDGLLEKHRDLLPLRNVPDGGYVAAVREVEDCTSLRAVAPGEIFGQGFTTLGDGRMVFAIPPIQFYDRSGGTQSAGDTIDVSFIAAEARAYRVQTKSSGGPPAG